jgi:thermitase
MKPKRPDRFERRFSTLILLCFVLFFLLSNIALPCGNAEDNPAKAPKMPRFVPGQILVKFRDEADIGVAAQELSRRREPFKTITNTSALDSLNEKFRVKKMERLFGSKDGGDFKGRVLNKEIAGDLREKAKEKFLEKVESTRQRFIERTDRVPEGVKVPYLNHIYRVEFEDLDVDLLAASAAYAEDPGVEYAEPSYLRHLCFTPTDALFSAQWAHVNTEAELGWDVQTGSRGVTIAIIDTGVAYNHEDLADNMLGDCNEGCPQDQGYDFVDINTQQYIDAGYELIPEEDYTEVDNDPLDFNGHGSHCAGIAAGVGNNGVGIAGVCMECRIMPLRVAFSILEDGEENGSSEVDDIAKALVYAADNGADVINMSYGGEYSQVESEAIKYAYGMGVVLVAAAGNENTDSPINSYPAAYDHVIAVAATAGDDSNAYYSNYGDWVDVAAPGGDSGKDNMILSTVPLVGGILAAPSGYRYLQGGSMATAYVSGLAGLVLSSNGGWSSDEVRDIIRAGVDPVDSTYHIGTGRVNVRKAVESSHILAVEIPATAEEGDGVLVDGGSVSISGIFSSNLVVNLSSNDTTEVTVPSNVTVLSGQTIATFNITVIDDSSNDGTQTVTISASAEGWTSGSDTIAIRNKVSTSGGGGSSGGCFIETLRNRKETREQVGRVFSIGVLLCRDEDCWIRP